MEEYTISCFIPGNKNTFSVDIKKTLNVHHLKERIKKKNPRTFAAVDAYDLMLYRVTINTTLVKKERVEELERLTYNALANELMELNGDQWLSEYFGGSTPPGMKFYIIVRIPVGESICSLTPSLWSRRAATTTR